MTNARKAVKTLSNRDWRIALGRWYAKRQGWTGKSGGWVYDTKGKPVAQGYLNVYFNSHWFIWDIIERGGVQ